jgi:hypothetical protein
MEEQEIIQRLSELHNGSSTDPAVLCSATFREFSMDGEEITERMDLQGQLFQICHERGDDWTQI